MNTGRSLWRRYSPLAAIGAAHWLVTVILALGLADLPGWRLGAWLVNGLVAAIAVWRWPLADTPDIQIHSTPARGKTRQRSY